MKLQKGILGDVETPKAEPVQPRPAPDAQHSLPTTPSQPVEVEKNRLFETIEKESGSQRRYLKVFVLAVIAVLVAGGVIFYLTLPKPGDVVRAPDGLEQSVRDHLLEKQKRAATDITFYYCGAGSYWARSGVELRPDIANPVYRVGTYAVTAKGQDPNWAISSTPITAPEQDNPCS